MQQDIPTQEAQAILSPDAVRRLEQRYRGCEPPLMERAGAAAARLAANLLASSPARVLILAGPGNNGGDALVVARPLRQQGLDPDVVFLGDAQALPADAAAAHAAWLASGGVTLKELPAGPWGLVIDGLFGSGLKRPLSGLCAQWVERINTTDCPVLALDVPSGLDAASGIALGITVRASHTISFIALKPGLLTGDGPDHCGRIEVDKLGVELDAAADAGQTVAPALFAPALRPRRRNSHKGSYGSVGIVGGAPGMAGAALLAARAALHLGTGRVYVGMLERLAVDPMQPELMLVTPERAMAQSTCLALGPGLGDSPAAQKLLRLAIENPAPLLIDADGLNLLAAHPVLMSELVRRAQATLLTPHPAEAARLLGCSVAAIQADRVAAARTLAGQHRATVVLKGCGSVVATASGRWYINRTGNPGLASAGTGDVLAGMSAALLAQGLDAELALLAAVYLHGAAADACLAGGLGPVGLTAGEIIPAARRLLNEILNA